MMSASSSMLYPDVYRMNSYSLSSSHVPGAIFAITLVATGMLLVALRSTHFSSPAHHMHIG